MTLSDPELTQAVSKILLRSERAASVSVLRSTFVDTGLLPQLDNENNQILYGRRGTGKSHALRILGAAARSRGGVLDMYVDLRFLGSAHQAADLARPFTQRCLTLFKDLLIELFNGMIEFATDPLNDASVSGDALTMIDAFGDAITRLSGKVTERDVSVSSTENVGRKRSLGVTVGTSSLTASAAAERNRGEETALSQTYREVLESDLIYSDIRRTCESALKELGDSRLLLLVDEWTTFPPDIQPVFAEFLKRTFLPSNQVTIKIASLEYRSRFGIRGPLNQMLGFEVGGDISANLDLDDYYVYDRNPEAVTNTFQEILFKHITSELPSSYVARVGDLADGDALRRRLFAERGTFVELVRAGEGVVRDFISIFNRAYFIAQREGRANINIRAVREAARQWYETDKSINLSNRQYAVLQRIITDVVGDKRARSFLLDRRYASHTMIESLFDFRVVHLISRGYSDPDNPGVRYNIYTLDYGTFVDLIQTKRQPELDLRLALSDDADHDRVVPFNDRRSIRRVIVSPELLGDDGDLTS
jgi:hypothetical protein